MKQCNNKFGGFALLELLVAIAVFGIIVTFVLFSYGRVAEQLFTSNLAHEVALALREAQSYGVSVRQFKRESNDAQKAAFDAAYGIHFERNESKQFVLFVDSARGGDAQELRYDGRITDGCPLPECVSIFRVGKKNYIQKFCGVLPQDEGYEPESKRREECSFVQSGGVVVPGKIKFLDVLFKRPNPDALFVSDGKEGGKDYKAARIYLASEKGVVRAVEVWSTGQISIK